MLCMTPASATLFDWHDSTMWLTGHGVMSDYCFAMELMSLCLAADRSSAFLVRERDRRLASGDVTENRRDSVSGWRQYSYSQKAGLAGCDEDAAISKKCHDLV